jgi:hypothetical protein
VTRSPRSAATRRADFSSMRMILALTASASKIEACSPA